MNSVWWLQPYPDPFKTNRQTSSHITKFSVLPAYSDNWDRGVISLCLYRLFLSGIPLLHCVWDHPEAYSPSFSLVLLVLVTAALQIATKSQSYLTPPGEHLSSIWDHTQSMWGPKQCNSTVSSRRWLQYFVLPIPNIIHSSDHVQLTQLAMKFLRIWLFWCSVGELPRRVWVWHGHFVGLCLNL